MCDYDVKACKVIAVMVYALSMFYGAKFIAVGIPDFQVQQEESRRRLKQDLIDIVGSIRVDHSGYILEP